MHRREREVCARNRAKNTYSSGTTSKKEGKNTPIFFSSGGKKISLKGWMGGDTRRKKIRENQQGKVMGSTGAGGVAIVQFKKGGGGGSEKSGLYPP